MRLLFYLLPAVVLVPAGIYFFFFFRRFLSLFKLEKGKWYTKVMCLGFGIGCAAIGWWVFGLGAVLVYHFLVVCLIMELLNLILNKVWFHRKNKVWDFLYKSGIIGAAAVAFVLIYGYWNMHQIHLTEYDITSAKIEEGQSLDIAVISDLHLGTSMDTGGLLNWCNEIEEQSPDILLLAGDIFDEHTKREQMEEAAEMLAGVQSTYGTYYVFGNHDPNHYSASPEYTTEELRLTLKGAGVKVLEDETAMLTPDICLIGRKDASINDRKLIGELTEGLDEAVFKILLDHQPGRLKENEEAGINLQISGHTHAGQIWPTGPLMVLMGINEINYGHRNLGSLDVIVSSGIAGWGYAIRTGGQCEYVMIHLSHQDTL